MLYEYGEESGLDGPLGGAGPFILARPSGGRHYRELLKLVWRNAILAVPRGGTDSAPSFRATPPALLVR